MTTSYFLNFPMMFLFAVILIFFLSSGPSFLFVFLAFIHFSETISISIFHKKLVSLNFVLSLYKVRGPSSVITVMLLSKERIP